MTMFVIPSHQGLDVSLIMENKHLNLVLADTEEFRRIRKKPGKTAGGSGSLIEADEKRPIGLIILRGKNVMGVTPISKPPSGAGARFGKARGAGAPATMASGPGIARSAGRGMPGGLGGPPPGAAPGFPSFGPPPGFGRGAPPGFPPGPPGPPGGAGFPGFPGAGRGAPPGFGPR